MPRKPYAQLFDEGKKALAENRGKKIHVRREPPSATILGHVFVDLYEELKAKPRNDTVKRLFRECELDLDNPFHWIYALRLFCDLHYHRKQTEEWKRTPKFIATIQQDRATVLKKIPGASQIKQAERMIADFPERYGNYDNANSLRRLFSHKTKPKRSKSKKKARSYNDLTKEPARLRVIWDPLTSRKTATIWKALQPGAIQYEYSVSVL
jgi:hypothetical protein